MNRIVDRKTKNEFRKIIAIFLVILFLSVFIGSFIYIDKTLRPTITVLAETKALELANRSINKAVAEMVEGKINYEDLMDIQLDNNGKITMIQANTIMMNEIASAIALEIQDELKKDKTASSYIPIGTVSVNFKTEFESSGINQTRHRIYLEAQTQVKVVIPLITSTKQIKAQIPICETIIVGDVPESYVNIPEKNLGNVLPNTGKNTNK